MNLSAWTTAAKSGDVERMRFLLAQNSGSMLHACGKSVCASCTTRSPDNGAHWRSCQRRECANYGSSWDGATALHTASAAGHLEVLQLLIDGGADGAASHVPTPTELGRMGLMQGVNHLGFSCGGRPVVARLHVLAATDRVVISDVDGTITRSDLRGHVPRPLARLMLGDAQVRCVPCL